MHLHPKLMMVFCRLLALRRITRHVIRICRGTLDERTVAIFGNCVHMLVWSVGCRRVSGKLGMVCG